MAMAESINMEQSIADYLQHLDLGAESFTHLGDYFYTGADRRNSLDQMVHYCRFSEQLVVLAAEQGSGKTTLVDATVSQLHTVMDCCRIPAADISGSGSIVATLGKVLKLPMQSPSIKEFLVALKSRTLVDEEPEPVLIIIEEAEKLALAHIENLVKLHDLARNSMHLMLVGTLPLKRRIEKIALDNPHIKLFTLKPLSLPELESYIAGILQSVGFTGDQPLSHDQLIVLHEQSGGNIADINRMMPLLLESGSEQKTVSKRKLLPLAHLLALAALIAAVLAVVVFEFAMQEPAETAVKRTARELPIILPPRAVERNVPMTQAQGQTETVLVPRESVPPAEPEAKVVPKPKAVAAKPVEPKAKVVPKPKAITAKPVPVVAVKPEPAAKVDAVPPPKPTPKPALAASPVKAGLTAREQRLMAMDPGMFMLQVLGSSNEDGVRDYVKRYVASLPCKLLQGPDAE